MKFIEWKYEYSVGVGVLDSQHKHLVEIINKLEEAISKAKGQRVMNGILDELIGYTQEHFAFEERLMKEAGYADLEAHQRRHRRLIQKIERFQYVHINEHKRVTVDVREFLRTWLTDHILKEDRAYVPALKKSPVNV